MLENLTWQHYLGAALFLVAVIGIGWLCWQQATEADILAAKYEAELERKRRAWANKLEARRAKLRQAEQRGIAS
jgi:hypothetical protein